ncbi:MAG: hypothetical protein ACREWG_05700 [Gammaproteobacteria bacterium]
MASPLEPPSSLEHAPEDTALREVVRFLNRAQGAFALFFAVCDRAEFRDRCLIQLRALTAHGAAIVSLDAATEDPLAAAMAAAAGKPSALHIINLELAVPADESGLAPVRQMNLHRAEWQRLGCPVVFWVADYLLGIILRRAPDFADWRSGSLVLDAPATPLPEAAWEAARIERTRHRGHIEYWIAAPAVEREARIAELSTRIEARADGSGVAPARDHIQALWYRELAGLLVLTGRGPEAEPYTHAASLYWQHAGQERHTALTAAEIAEAWAYVGQLRLAITAMDRAHRHFERLLQANPDSAEAARDVSVSLERLGDFLTRRGQPGDTEQALKHFQRSLEVAERLLQAYPDSAEAARDVSVSLNKLGDLLTRRGQPGDTEQALKHVQRSLEVCERLLQANPDSAEAARDVWTSYWRLAWMAEQTGQGDASGWWRKAYAILNGLKARGAFVSPDDERSFDELRHKLGL